MPRNAFPFARHPIEGVPHGTAIAIGPSPFSGSKGRRNNPTSPTLTGMDRWMDAHNLSTLFQDSAGTTPVTANNDPVGRWNDANGSAKRWDQAGAGNRPLYKTNILNGKAGVKFDGTDDFMTVVTSFSANLLTVFAVVSGWTTTGQRPILASHTDLAGGEPKYGIALTTGLPDITEYGVAVIHTGNAAPSTSGAIVVYQYDQITAATWDGLTSTGSTAATNSIEQDITRLGALTHSINEFFNGYIHELIIYTAAISTSDRISTTQYLKAKWGL
jgi:hypothetical protein